MTKKIRVENADIANYKVKAEVWTLDVDGKPLALVTTHDLDFPATMAEIYIHSGCCVIVKEAL